MSDEVREVRWWSREPGWERVRCLWYGIGFAALPCCLRVGCLFSLLPQSLPYYASLSSIRLKPSCSSSHHATVFCCSHATISPHLVQPSLSVPFLLASPFYALPQVVFTLPCYPPSQSILLKPSFRQPPRYRFCCSLATVLSLSLCLSPAALPLHSLGLLCSFFINALSLLLALTPSCYLLHIFHPP